MFAITVSEDKLLLAKTTIKDDARNDGEKQQRIVRAYIVIILNSQLRIVHTL